MKALRETISYPVHSSFKISRYTLPRFDMPYHYHSEYEMVYICRGKGVRYIGGSVQKFGEGDLVFLGPGLAHIWINQEDEDEVEGIVVQFPEKLLRPFTSLPEFREVKELLENSAYGLQIIGETKDKLVSLLKNSVSSNGIRKINYLLEFLDLMTNKTERKIIDPWAQQEKDIHNDKRINDVQRLVRGFYNRNIGIPEAASLANMENSSFCRFFKQKTGKSFTKYLNETRVDRACSLLLENKLTISQLAFDCGFNNISNFYRQFGKITGKTPAEYKKGHISKL